MSQQTTSQLLQNKYSMTSEMLLTSAVIMDTTTQPFKTFSTTPRLLLSETSTMFNTTGDNVHNSDTDFLVPFPKTPPTGEPVLSVSWEIIIPFLVVSVVVLFALFFCCWNSRKATIKQTTISGVRDNKCRLRLDGWRGSTRSTTPFDLGYKWSNRADHIIPYLNRSPGRYGHLQVDGEDNSNEKRQVPPKQKPFPRKVFHYENIAFESDPHDFLSSPHSIHEHSRAKTAWRSEPSITEHDRLMTTDELDSITRRDVTSEPILNEPVNDPFFPNFNTPVKTSDSTISNEFDMALVNHPPYLPTTTPYNTPVATYHRPSVPSSDSTTHLSNPRFPSMASRGESPENSYSFISKLEKIALEEQRRTQMNSVNTNPASRSGSVTPYPNSTRSRVTSRGHSLESSPEYVVSGDVTRAPDGAAAWQYNNIFMTRNGDLHTSHPIAVSNTRGNVAFIEPDSNNTSVCFPSNDTSMFPAVGSGNTSIIPAVGSTNTSDQHHTISGNASTYHSTTGLGSEVATSACTSLQHSVPGFEHAFCSAEGISEIVISSIEGSMSNTPNKPKTSTANTSSTQLHHGQQLKLVQNPQEEHDAHAHMVYKQKAGRPASLVVQVTHDNDINHNHGYSGKVSIIQWSSPGSAPALMESELPDHHVISWWPQPLLSKKQYWV